MKTIEILKSLERKPVFTLNDIQRLEGCSRPYAWQVVSRLRKKGVIKKVAENAYTTKDDINVIASSLIYPSYISFWYASYFLGYTEQIVNTVHIATTTRKAPVEFENYKIKFIPIKHFFGYRKIRTAEGEMFVVDDEKLLIDAFLRPKECGNFDEIEKMFENAKISEEKTVDYLKRTGMQTIIKRVGFLLEKKKGIDISGHFNLDNNYVFLNPFSQKYKTLKSKWRLKV